jgi:hypothetical protein
MSECCGNTQQTQREQPFVVGESVAVYVDFKIKIFDNFNSETTVQWFLCLLRALQFRVDQQTTFFAPCERPG